VEYSLEQLEPAVSETSMTQRRADAAVLKAENNLQQAGLDIATADRYQGIVSVDAAQLRNGSDTSDSPDTSAGSNDVTPTMRATILGASSSTGRLAKDAGRRLGCDCSVSVVITNKGQPLDSKQRTSSWSAAKSRPIRARDQSCVWPDCSQSRHLRIHHIVHWADGGATSLKTPRVFAHIIIT